MASLMSRLAFAMGMLTCSAAASAQSSPIILKCTITSGEDRGEISDKEALYKIDADSESWVRLLGARAYTDQCSKVGRLENNFEGARTNCTFDYKFYRASGFMRDGDFLMTTMIEIDREANTIRTRTDVETATKSSLYTSSGTCEPAAAPKAP